MLNSIDDDLRLWLEWHHDSITWNLDRTLLEYLCRREHEGCSSSLIRAVNERRLERYDENLLLRRHSLDHIKRGGALLLRICASLKPRFPFRAYFHDRSSQSSEDERHCLEAHPSFHMTRIKNLPFNGSMTCRVHRKLRSGPRSP